MYLGTPFVPSYNFCAKVYFFLILVTPGFFDYCCMKYFFYHFIFILFVSLSLKCVSWKQHIVRFCIFIHPAGLFCLTVKFNPLKFNIITNEVGFMSSILLFAFYLFYVPFVPLSFNYCFLLYLKGVFLVYHFHSPVI